MTTYRRELYNPMYFPQPALPFNGGYGANPTSQAPYATNDTAAVYYPYHYQANPHVVDQEHLRLPWSSTQPACAMQLAPQQFQNTPAYFCMDSNYYCGQSATLQNFTQLTPRVSNDDNSANQTQYVSFAPFTTPTPTALSLNASTNRQEGFIRTVPRKVYISRPAKYAWNFSNFELRSIVERCIARKREADGNPTALCTSSSQIENIENPRSRNGTYKGYAILTFNDPKAANIAIEALNHEGHFNAKIDKDRIPASTQNNKSVGRKVCIDRIPSHHSRHFFCRLIEDCIPSAFATISACGIPMYDSIEIFDFPTRVDGTSEGYASMTFSSDTVANIVVGALQARGFGAYLEHEHMNAYVQSLILTQPYAPISQQAWSAPRQGPRQAVFSVPIPRVPKVAQATKTVRTPKAAGTSSTVPKAKVVRQLPKVQIFEVTQPSLVTPLSPILGPGPAFHLPRSAPVANGYDSWHGIGSADEDGRRSV